MCVRLLSYLIIHYLTFYFAVLFGNQKGNAKTHWLHLTHTHTRAGKQQERRRQQHTYIYVSCLLLPARFIILAQIVVALQVITAYRSNSEQQRCEESVLSSALALSLSSSLSLARSPVVVSKRGRNWGEAASDTLWPWGTHTFRILVLLLCCLFSLCCCCCCPRSFWTFLIVWQLKQL